MDTSTDWPWDWEEEAEWKAELENRDYEFLESLIDSAFEDGIRDWGFAVRPRLEEEPTESDAPGKYSLAV
jgi:hypothetical protein